MSTGSIRPPAVAGQFYPADPDQLRSQVEDYLDRAPDADIAGPVRGLVAPHAGYAYSGQVAGAAYRQVRGDTFDTVVILAPSHLEACGGASIFDGDAYQTPLGELRVDHDLADRLTGIPGVRRSPIGHQVWPHDADRRGEHAIEVHLPFLQIAVGDPAIVPIVMDSRELALCRGLADALAEEDGDILVVASSDLCHTDDYAKCRESDDRTLQDILEGDVDHFLDDIRNGRAEACGAGPVATAMMACRRMGADRTEQISRLNSNDAIGRRVGYVVGYGAVVFWGSAEPEEASAPGTGPSGLPANDREALGRIARRTIRRTVTGASGPEAPGRPVHLKTHRGVFVTLRHSGRLRGCIGDLQGVNPLFQAVEQMAAAAASRDPRFPPITSYELDGLQVEISIISPLQAFTGPAQIETGRHGLFVRRGLRCGVLLPVVAAENGWGAIEFLQQTCRKAGLPPDAWEDPETEIQVFTADVFPA